MSNGSSFEVQIESKLDMMVRNLEIMKEKQEEMAEDISKIKDAVYNPDHGLYARLRELESWKSSSSKMIWILFTSMVGVVSTLLLKMIST
jgi:hypothetical protein